MKRLASVFILVLVIVSTVFSQNSAKIYKLESGKTISKSQADSLAKVYEGRIKYLYTRKGGTQIVTLRMLSEDDSMLNENASTDTRNFILRKKNKH